MRTAWWWLSQAATSPDERLHALQKVMALNPDHLEAHAQLLDQRPGSCPPERRLQPRMLPEWADAAARGAPRRRRRRHRRSFQCPYCGKPTGSDDAAARTAAAACTAAWPSPADSESLRLVLLLLGIGLAFGVVELASPLLALGFRQGQCHPRQP